MQSQMNPVHTFTFCFCKMHSSIILPSKPRSSERSLPFRFRYQNFVRISDFSSACYMPRPSNRPRLDHVNNIWWRRWYCASVLKCTISFISFLFRGAVNWVVKNWRSHLRVFFPPHKELRWNLVLGRPLSVSYQFDTLYRKLEWVYVTFSNVFFRKQFYYKYVSQRWAARSLPLHVLS
jgi:hypothetical protein